MEIYSQYKEQVKLTLKAFEDADKPDVPINIEEIVQILRQFLYLLLYVDYLKGEVDSMCQNHITLMDKLSP
jgi:hypothetical protein